LKSELLIFITPHIIKTTDDLIELSSRPSKKMEVIQSVEQSKELREAVKEVTSFEQKFIDKPDYSESKKPLPEKPKSTTIKPDEQ